MWKEIETDAGIEAFMGEVGYFHDSCLRDIHISTREYVDEKLAMHFDNKIIGTLLFQSQFKQNPVFEMRFEDIVQFNFNPLEEGYYGVIYEATFKRVNDLLYWSSEENWEVGDNEAIWICSKKVYWRLRPELKGNITRVKET